MVSSDAVPESSTSYSSVDEYEQSSHSLQLSDVPMAVNHTQSHSDHRKLSAGRRPSVPEQPSERDRSNHMELPREHPPPVVERSSDVIYHSDTEESPAARSVIPDFITHLASEDVLAESISSPKNGDDYLSVRATDNLLDFDINDGHGSVDGYIITSNGLVHATAYLAPTFSDNLIAARYATELGLQIEPLDEDDRIPESIILRNGQQVCKTGKVSLRWSHKASSNRPIFPVHCWVLEHSLKDLIFGQPFVQKQQHYGRGHPSSEDGR